MTYILKKSIAIAVAGVFMLQGCATNGSKGSDGSNKVANSVAVGGGILGVCLLAKQPLARCLLLAAAGGGIAYAIQVAVENKKVKTADEVNNEAKLANKSIPKNGLQPLDFDVSLNPNTTVKTGDKVVLESTAKLYGNGNHQVQQSTQLFGQDGKPLGQPRIEAFKSDGNAAGAYTSTATYTIPSGWAGQKFNFKTAVLVDGKEVATKDDVKMTVMAEMPSNSGMVASK